MTKKLTQRDRRVHADLLAAMANRRIHESRLEYVYHYEMNGDVDQACESYLEARHDGNEVACRGE